MRGGIVLVLAATFLLAGCQTTVTPGGVVSPGTGSTPGSHDLIAQAQSVASTTCRFLPQASSIAELLASGVPGLTTGLAIGRAICDAYVGSASVRAIGGSSRAALPRVNGVLIMGTRV